MAIQVGYLLGMSFNYSVLYWHLCSLMCVIMQPYRVVHTYIHVTAYYNYYCREVHTILLAIQSGAYCTEWCILYRVVHTVLVAIQSGAYCTEWCILYFLLYRVVHTVQSGAYCTEWCILYREVHTILRAIQSGAYCTEWCILYLLLYRVVHTVQSGAYCTSCYTDWCILYFLLYRVGHTVLLAIQSGAYCIVQTGLVHTLPDSIQICVYCTFCGQERGLQVSDEAWAWAIPCLCS